MKYLNSQVKEGRLQLKAFPSAKANQLNHYIIPRIEEFHCDCAIIYRGINNILRSKDMSELKDLPKKLYKQQQFVKVLTLVRYMFVLFYRRPELPLISVKLTKS